MDWSFRRGCHGAVLVKKEVLRSMKFTQKHNIRDAAKKMQSLIISMEVDFHDQSSDDVVVIVPCSRGHNI